MPRAGRRRIAQGRDGRRYATQPFRSDSGARGGPGFGTGAAPAMTDPLPPSPRHRHDIDGLRAIAIVPVVLNHLGLRGVWGGYVGVDVFFVISGFLITGNIAAGTRAGRHSIADFYRRRVLRIFPALFAMLAVIWAVALAVMLPAELARHGRAMLGATWFASNWLFNAEAGYFEPAARLKPLLHTWSLAIEEQFYILWPLLLPPLIRRAPRLVLPITALVIAGSLAVSILTTRSDPQAAYYLLPARAWELGMGAFVALLPPPALPRLLREALALCGLGAILGAVHWLTEASPFPGWLALWPCGGAALLILTGREGTWVARVLSTAPFTAIGRVSYSLYLWHWPVIVFAGIGLFLAPTPAVIVAELAVMLALAAGSTRWIERPFRHGAWPVRRVLAAGAIAMAGSSGLALTVILGQGLPGRFTPAQQAVAAYAAFDGDGAYRRGTCFAVGQRMVFAASRCLATPAPAAHPLPDLLVLGDSHAAHLWPGLARHRDRFNVLQATHTGCRPLLYPAPGDACQAMMRAMLGPWLASHRPALVLLAARWQPGDLPLLQSTLADPVVRAADPVVIGPVPQYPAGLPRLLVMADARQAPDLPARSRDPQVAETDLALRRLTARMGVRYVSMADLLCNGSTCETWAAPGVPLQFDYGHFTVAGSALAADRLLSQIAPPHQAGALAKAPSW